MKYTQVRPDQKPSFQVLHLTARKIDLKYVWYFHIIMHTAENDGIFCLLAYTLILIRNNSLENCF
jgi:hypothetical protein